MNTKIYIFSLVAALLIGFTLLLPTVPAFAASASQVGISTLSQFADGPVTSVDNTTMEPPAPPPPPPAPDTTATATTAPTVTVAEPVVIPSPVLTVSMVTAPESVSLAPTTVAKPAVTTAQTVTAQRSTVSVTPSALVTSKPLVTETVAPSSSARTPSGAPAQAGHTHTTWPSDNSTPPHPFTPHPNTTWPDNGHYQGSVNYPWSSSAYYPTVPVYQQSQPIYYAPVISSFTADPSYIQQGQTATLVWTVSNADTVTISPSAGTVANAGSFPVSPSYTTTYTLSAYNDQGSVSASTTVMVAPYVSSYSTFGTGSSSGTVAIGSTGYYSSDTPSTNASSTISTSGVSSGSTTAVNPWLMYVFLIGILAVAAGVVIFLLVRKPVVAQGRSQSGTSTGYLASSTAFAATMPALTTLVTAPVEASLAAKFVLPDGTTMSVIGKPLGRSDFQTLVLPEKADLISRQHILVTYENSQYQIEDLNSTNGTKLNGSSITGSGHTIANGDNVELAGTLNLTFKV